MLDWSNPGMLLHASCRNKSEIRKVIKTGFIFFEATIQIHTCAILQEHHADNGYFYFHLCLDRFFWKVFGSPEVKIFKELFLDWLFLIFFKKLKSSFNKNEVSFNMLFRSISILLPLQLNQIILIYKSKSPRLQRKMILKRGIKAIEYFEYCEEVGCDVWGILVSIKEALYEPVGLWLPPQMIPKGTLTNHVRNLYIQPLKHILMTCSLRIKGYK